MSAVYLLHFDPPYKRVRHYIGYTKYDDCQQRLATHIAGRGAKLTRIAVANGCEIKIALIFEGADRAYERQLKRMKQASRICPLCSAAKADERKEF